MAAPAEAAAAAAAEAAPAVAPETQTSDTLGLISSLRYQLGLGANSTAAKIVDGVENVIKNSKKVKAICLKKQWLTPTKNLDLTISFAQAPLGQKIAASLESRTHYVAYQTLGESEKEAFRSHIADQLATAILQTADAKNASGSERAVTGLLWNESKPTVTATITFTPLRDDVICEAVCKAAEAAQILKKLSA